MEMTNAPQYCFLFDILILNIQSKTDCIEYSINMNNKTNYLKFHWDYKNTSFIDENKHILKGLLLNNKFPFIDSNEYYTVEIIEQIINNSQFPKTPKEKLDNLLIYIYENQKFEGDEFSLGMYNNDVSNKLYLKNKKEFSFYIESLFELNYIYRTTTTDYYGLKLSFKGLEYIIKLENEGNNSKNCFIAMSFSEEAQPIRNSIKSAIRKTNFEPILIDEVNYESDVTINDAMIGFIRKSKFMVADFTHQKHGVYFEAGFALGLKKPVIYTCHIDDFKQTHFDTNHYPHIVYETYEDLEEKLIDKINAWII